MFNIKQLFVKNNYVSELDCFLSEFDNAHPKLSSSQQLERNTYAKLFALRDSPHDETLPIFDWQKFLE